MAPATVLLIDNDADSITIYSLILRHHGYEVVHALDGETGLQLAFERNPDLVISELFMPPTDGGNLLDRLRQDARTAETPLIILDSIPTFGWERLESLGQLSRLTKPCEPSRLLQEVSKILDQGASLH
jgi:CheY-like chemotaxis protein